MKIPEVPKFDRKDFPANQECRGESCSGGKESQNQE
jgi:hypothetical protein